MIPLTPELTSNPGSLLQGVVVGQQKVVSFVVSNLGGVPSGDLQVQLPTGIPWLALASPSTIPSLAPGALTTVTLTLTPPSGTPLALFQGTIALTGSDAQLNVGFQFPTISTAVGDLQVSVADEYTYYAAGAPLVAGATVELLDPYDNTVIVAQGTTDASGTITLKNVPEGNYVLDVEAPGHDPYRGPITVTAGVPNQTQAFISRQLVTYTWNVTPAQIQDTYQIQLQSTFETGVPAPVLTLDGPDTIPTLAPGQSIQVMYTATNYGLIAIQDAQFGFLSNDDYDLIPLTNNIGTIPAMSSIQIPVLIRAKDASASDVSASGTNPTPLCSAFTAFVKGFNLCGVTLVQWVAFHASFFPIYTLACIADAILGPIAKLLGAGGGGGGGPGSPGGAATSTLPPGGGGTRAAPHQPSLTTSRGPRRRTPGTTSARRFASRSTSPRSRPAASSPRGWSSTMAAPRPT